MAKTMTRTAPPITGRSEVEVTEPGIRTWTGIAMTAKFSPVSGWWLEVRREGEGIFTRVVHSDYVTVLGEVDDGGL